MIHIERPPCPAILEQKAQAWTERHLEKLVENPKIRPLKSQYAHRDIVDILAAMSHRKCFYCESRLDEDEYTVDHYIECSEEPAQSFVWENLYLCCKSCQGKLAEKTVPRADCIDPCDPAVDPADHLAFEDEIIRARGDSRQGRQTIRKHKLDRGELELRRARQLKRFYQVLAQIRLAQIDGGRRALTDHEAERLRSFAAPEHPFSLMFRHVLAAAELR